MPGKVIIFTKYASSLPLGFLLLHGKILHKMKSHLDALSFLCSTACVTNSDSSFGANHVLPAVIQKKRRHCDECESCSACY